jgi:hypothetical protein
VPQAHKQEEFALQGYLSLRSGTFRTICFFVLENIRGDISESEPIEDRQVIRKSKKQIE